ncbi:MAG: hypothetical protein ACYSX0_00310 [Planctomycetota bacterium]
MPMENLPEATPVVFCYRQKRWLAVVSHLECDFCAAPVFDEADDPVSFLCTHEGEKREVQSGWEDGREEGYGPPAKPPGLE